VYWLQHYAVVKDLLQQLLMLLPSSNHADGQTARLYFVDVYQLPTELHKLSIFSGIVCVNA